MSVHWTAVLSMYMYNYAQVIRHLLCVIAWFHLLLLTGRLGTAAELSPGAGLHERATGHPDWHGDHQSGLPRLDHHRAPSEVPHQPAADVNQVHQRTAPRHQGRSQAHLCRWVCISLCYTAVVLLCEFFCFLLLLLSVFIMKKPRHIIPQFLYILLIICSWQILAIISEFSWGQLY